jgi:malate synthase
MEDTATAEISRTQLWQWTHHPDAAIKDTSQDIKALYRTIADEETQKLKEMCPDDAARKRVDAARQLLDALIENAKCPDFLTLTAYESLA